MLESRSFPSATVSTHFFRGDGLVRALAEVGDLDEVLATGAPPFRGELFFVDDATEPSVDPPQEPGDIASVSRSGARRWTRSWPVGWRRHQVSPAVCTPRWSGSCTTPVA